jgi:hypothetical protein
MTSVFDSRVFSEQTHPLRPLALAQKLLIYAIIALFVLRIGMLITMAVLPHPLTFVFYALAYVATLILMLVAIVHLAATCGYSIVGRVLLVIAMFLPLINLITLLVLNSQATRQLREAGVKIGFMGANLSRM